MNSRKVLCNLAEFLLKEKKLKPDASLKLLNLAMRIPNQKEDKEFGRILSISAHVFGRQKLYAQSEEMFKNAERILENCSTFERIECLSLNGDLLQQIKGRDSFGKKMIELSKEESRLMPFWYSSMVNVFIPEMEFN